VGALANWQLSLCRGTPDSAPGLANWQLVHLAGWAPSALISSVMWLAAVPIGAGASEGLAEGVPHSVDLGVIRNSQLAREEVDQRANWLAHTAPRTNGRFAFRLAQVPRHLGVQVPIGLGAVCLPRTVSAAECATPIGTATTRPPCECPTWRQRSDEALIRTPRFERSLGAVCFCAINGANWLMGRLAVLPTNCVS
jgi:hypothetical protein